MKHPVKAVWLLMTLLCLMISSGRAATRDWERFEQGTQGATVKSAQYLLRARGYKVVADGKFGQQTKNAVMRYQKAHGLVVDGVIGSQTWESLIVKVKGGSRGDAVRALQVRLRDLGYDVPLSGIFGTKTLAAVKQFQEEEGDVVDGVVGPQTWYDVVNSNYGGSRE